ncbi:AAA family ATPase [candidate division KSB1 bacterium]|nr:AAA family ATPase [candidate division KSB1 bacterium]
MSDIFNHGSIWLKSDFHLHTKADKEFKYDQEPNNFVRRYIEQLKMGNVGIGFISNHNKFDKDEFKALYRSALKDDIFLLPGVELSVNDGSNGIHCIIAFDFDSWIIQNENFIEQFLNSAFEGIPNRENENTRCRYNLTDLFKKLEEHRKEYRDSFIIMAHLEQKSGFCNELDGGRIEQLANDELFKRNVLAFQKLRSRDLKIKLANWFGGEALLPAFVEGSDCKNLGEVGLASTQKNFKGTDTPKCTYLKLGDYNFEAVKYGFIDHFNRIREVEIPAIKNSYIKSIYFESSSRGLLHDTQIDFSPELNNFIGIRGSGKSAILELIRYSMGLSLGKQAVDKDYKNGLIEYALKSGGKLTLTIVNEHGKEYRIQKIYGQKEDIFDENNQRVNASINESSLKKPRITLISRIKIGLSLIKTISVICEISG